MALNLYLDDCSNSDLLAVLLHQAGHTVKRPNDPDVNLLGEDDDVHLAFAANKGLAIQLNRFAHGVHAYFVTGARPAS